MKLLVALPSDRPKRLAKGALTWAPRAGFDLRIFTSGETSKNKFINIIEDTNYNQYLDLRHDMLIVDSDPLTYAQAKSYDLLAVVPPELKTWNGNKNIDKMIIEFQTDLAETRNKMAKDLKLHDVSFDNGTRVVRVVNLK